MIDLDRFVSPFVCRWASTHNEAAPDFTFPVPGAVLVADLAGFTTMAEQLAGRGRAGIEAIQDILNRSFERVVEVIDGGGGEVITFAGDATLAWWPAPDDMRNAVLRAASTGLQLQAVIPQLEKTTGVPLRLRVAVGAGNLWMAIAGGVWVYRVFDNAIVRDPVKLAAVIAEIARGAEIPAGYEAYVDIDIFGLKGVMITVSGANPSAAASTLFLVGSVSASSSANLEVGMRRGFAEDTGEYDETEILGEEVIEVGGVEVTFELVRVTSEGGDEMLQYSAELPERAGRRTMLIFMGPKDRFDRQAMDLFLASFSDLRR